MEGPTPLLRRGLRRKYAKMVFGVVYLPSISQNVKPGLLFLDVFGELPIKSSR